MTKSIVSLLVLLLWLPWAGASESAGGQLFSRCATCHLPEGQGIEGAFPPLQRRLGLLAVSELGRDYLVLVVRFGLIGPLQIEGASYAGAMPGQGFLSDRETAQVLNFMLTRLNKQSLPENWQPYTEESVAESLARHAVANGNGVYQIRQRLMAQLAAAGG